MEDFQSLKGEAIRYMKIADHILTMTYPLVQDPKLLKLVMKNIYLSLDNGIAAFLQYEKARTRSFVFARDYLKMVSKMKPLLKKYGLSAEYINFLNDLYEVVQNQKNSEVEFVRKEKFVFTKEDYKLNVLTKKEVKEYIIKSKLLLKELLGVIK